MGMDADALIGAGVLLGAGLVVAVALGVWVTVRKLRWPARRTYAWAVARGIPGDPGEMVPARRFEEIEIDLGRGGRAAGWLIEGKDPNGPTVVVTPGWGSSRLGALFRLDGLEGWARGVIAWDPPGHGETEGPSALGTAEPAQIARIVEQFVDGSVVLMGWSLGGGASIVAAAEMLERGVDVVGVIAEAPYREAWTPAFRVMRGAGMPWRVNGPVAMGCLGIRFGLGPRWKGFDRAAWSRRVGCPVLVVHGTADPVSPIEDGRAIAAAAVEGEMLEVEGGGHNDLWSDERGAAVRAGVERFVRERVVGGGAAGE